MFLYFSKHNLVYALIQNNFQFVSKDIVHLCVSLKNDKHRMFLEVSQNGVEKKKTTSFNFRFIS